MRINRVYTTVSGETGGLIPQGYPCTIVRTQGCNINCWYCDSKETQSWESGKDYSVSDLVSIVESFGLPVLLTGGEPLLQKDFEEFVTRCTHLGLAVQIETNGTLPIFKFNNLRVGYVIDYKFGEEFAVDMNNLEIQDVVKFVVENEEQLKVAVGIIKEHEDCEVRFAISPVHGKDQSFARTVSEYIVDGKIDAVLNIQLHKFINMP